MNHTLRRRFLLVLGAGSTLAWGLLAVWLYWQIESEVSELFDAHIAEGAKVLAALVRSESLEYAPLAASQSADFDSFVLAELQLHLEMPVYAQDHAYQISFGDPPHVLHSPNAPATPLAPAAIPGFSEQRVGSAQWRTYTLVAQGSDGPIVVTVGEPRAVRAQAVRRLALGLSAPVLSTLALLLWLLRWGTTWGLRPLSSLTHQVARRSPGDLRLLAVAEVPLEIRPLTESLNHLLERLAAALQSEREFTADAAHELRNPLAAIKIQAQVAQRARTATERNAALAQIVVGIDDTTHIVTQLLSLARLDPEFSQGELDLLDLHEAVAEIFTEVARDAMKRPVALHNEVPVGLRLRANRAALKVALRNLVDNGIKHGASPGQLRVSAVQNSSGATELVIEDDGPGIPVTARVQVQRRFARLPGTSAPGTGLGLAIVARIAQLHRATFELDSSTAGGLRVSLLWPALKEVRS